MISDMYLNRILTDICKWRSLNLTLIPSAKYSSLSSVIHLLSKTSTSLLRPLLPIKWLMTFTSGFSALKCFTQLAISVDFPIPRSPFTTITDLCFTTTSGLKNKKQRVTWSPTDQLTLPWVFIWINHQTYSNGTLRQQSLYFNMFKGNPLFGMLNYSVN